MSKKNKQEELQDRAVILAYLVTGSVLTMIAYERDNLGLGLRYEVGHAWLNKYTDREMKVDYKFAKELLLLNLLECESGNFETGERHYLLRTVIQKRDGRWKVRMIKDDEYDHYLRIDKTITDRKCIIDGNDMIGYRVSDELYQAYQTEKENVKQHEFDGAHNTAKLEEILQEVKTKGYPFAVDYIVSGNCF